MHQIVYADLKDLVNKHISAPERSIIVKVNPNNILDMPEIVDVIAGVADCLLGVKLNARSITDYIYLNDSTKETYVKELHILNMIGEKLGRPIYYVCSLAKEFPKWDVCKQHIQNLFEQYNKLFPNIIFVCSNIGIVTGRNEYIDVTPDYMTKYFKDVPSMNFLPDATYFGNDSSISVIKKNINRCIAVIDKPGALVAKNTGIPVMIKGVDFKEMCEQQMRNSIPNVNVAPAQVAGTDEFLNSMLSVIAAMSK